MSDMVEVIIESIRVSLMSQQRIVILREQDADRYLPIWIGVFEAESITIALQEVEVARPLTHDLIKNIFEKLNARILRVEVIALRDDTFYGNIVVESNGEIINIDSRPSDALAIAVRTHVPVFVERSVMDSAAIIPDKDLKVSIKTLTELNIKAFDLICVNLYNFADAVQKGLKEKDLIEQIDIGGPTLLRAAAKNYHSIAVVPDPSFYKEIMEELKNNEFQLSIDLRKKMAIQTFFITFNYDKMIYETLSKS
jgi:bifunctional DNase/RNase